MTEVNEVITNIRANAANQSYGVFFVKITLLAARRCRIAEFEIDEKQGVVMSGLRLKTPPPAISSRNLRSAKMLRRDPQIETEKEGDYWRFSMTHGPVEGTVMGEACNRKPPTSRFRRTQVLANCQVARGRLATSAAGFNAPVDGLGIGLNDDMAERHYY